jgi:DNA adenine methylase
MSLKKISLPFRYPGGKYYALNLLAPFWSDVEHDEFREPFVGGGSVFFAKNKSNFNLLNDIDTELITTYRVMQDADKRKALLELLSPEVASKERWKEMIDFKPSTDIEIAYKYYYLNRTSFSGKLSSPAWGYRDKRSVPPERWHEKIISAGEKLSDIEITNTDFESIIEMPSRGKKTLLFVDPPYFSPPKKKHYRNGFNYEDHLRLAESLQKTTHKFFLTYDDLPEIRTLYKWANISEAQFVYRVENAQTQNGLRRMGLELIITNYELNQQLEIFKS